MAVISVPHNSPWVVARWAFRMLLERAARRLENEGDKDALQQAVALDGWHFDLLEADQRKRLAWAIAAAADELRLDLQTASADPRDLELVEMLANLEMLLHDLYE
jgi:hypothetical protein